jgi:FkbM family methyltransferase
MQYNCAINIEGAVSPVNIIATEGWVDFQNTFSQYITSFIDEKFIPKKGDVVFDCGSCIGETSVLMGALVGGSGQVHMFDPVPLHIRFCEYQAKSNPDIKHIFFPVEFAVSDVSSTSYNDVDKKLVISPGRLATENFSKISIDDYVEKNKINQLNYIKMDIEGSEGSALIGASNSIKKFTPKLAISAYHKFDDFWTIPNIIKSLNPDYKIYFSHHSPVNWESVIYAG